VFIAPAAGLRNSYSLLPERAVVIKDPESIRWREIMTRWKLVVMICALAPCRGAGWGDLVGRECADLNRAVLNQAANGKLAEAEADLRTAMANRRSELRPACEGLMLHNLAALTLLAGSLAEAESLAERAIAILEPVLGPENTGLLRPVHVLFSTRLDQGKIGRARESLLKMQRIRVTNPQEQALLHGAEAALLRAEGRFGESELAFRLALRDWQEAGQSDGGEVGSVLSGLTSLYLTQERLKEAADVLDQAFAAVNDAPDAAPADHLKLLRLRAALERRQGEWPKAAEDLRQALNLVQREPDSGLLAALMTEYAEALRRQHRRREARAVEKRVAALRVASKGNEVVDATQLLPTGAPRKR
jgi:tetratricopeptide (TPR) repeat protein